MVIVYDLVPFDFGIYFGDSPFFILAPILWVVFTQAPFVPTRRRDLQKILEIARIKHGEIFYDLGSGDGRLVRAAARSGAKAFGFERAWPLVLWSRFLIFIFGLRGQASIVRANFLKINLSQADVIFCYLMPKGMDRLKPKLETELKPGARVFSRTFAVPGWLPMAVHCFGKYASPVYEYKR